MSFLKQTSPASVNVKTHIEANCPEIIGDISHVNQVIHNIFTNALQALPSGKGNISVALYTISFESENTQANLPPGNYVCIEFKDDGQGMPPDVLQNMFTPFYTTKAVGKGSGLGMSSVLGI